MNNKKETEIQEALDAAMLDMDLELAEQEAHDKSINERFNRLADENAALRKQVEELEYRSELMAKKYGKELKAYADDRYKALKRVEELEGVVEVAFREGFEDGFDHGNLSYKYPGVDEAWEKSCVREEAALAAKKEEG